MADEAVVTFESEEKKAEAINQFDETKGTPEDLEKLMGAPVAPKSEPVAEKKVEADLPPQDKTSEPAEPTEKTETHAEAAQPPQSKVPDDFDWTKWAKDHGYATPGEARKAFDEKTRFINEKLAETPKGQNAGYEALLQKNRELEARIASQTPAPTASKEEKAQSVTSKINTVKEALNNNLLKKRSLIAELKEDSSRAYDPEFLEKQQAVDEEKYGLDMQLVDEITNLRGLQETASQKLTDFTRSREDDSRREQGQRMYESEMAEIDAFAGNTAHPEFSFTTGKNSKAVESEYVEWANKVASSLYGANVNMLRSVQEREAVASALERLGANDPEVVNSCSATGTAIEPPADVRKYLDICELLDHRDGQRKDPMTGKKVQQYRTVRDPMTGAFRKDPVRFPSLEDAYNHKLAVDGTFQKRIKDSYSKGGKDALAAAAKRSSGPVVLDNAGGVGKADVGLSMTPKQAMDTIANFDETEAQRRRLSGDNTMMDQYMKAMDIINAVNV
jgi:hypothetical protein